jgi:hypothetical protein
MQHVALLTIFVFCCALLRSSKCDNCSTAAMAAIIKMEKNLFLQQQQCSPNIHGFPFHILSLGSLAKSLTIDVRRLQRAMNLQI